MTRQPTSVVNAALQFKVSGRELSRVNFLGSALPSSISVPYFYTFIYRVFSLCAPALSRDVRTVPTLLWMGRFLMNLHHLGGRSIQVKDSADDDDTQLVSGSGTNKSFDSILEPTAEEAIYFLFTHGWFT